MQGSLEELLQNGRVGSVQMGVLPARVRAMLGASARPWIPAFTGMTSCTPAPLDSGLRRNDELHPAPLDSGLHRDDEVPPAPLDSGLRRNDELHPAPLDSGLRRDDEVPPRAPGFRPSPE